MHHDMQRPGGCSGVFSRATANLTALLRGPHDTQGSEPPAPGAARRVCFRVCFSWPGLMLASSHSCCREGIVLWSALRLSPNLPDFSGRRDFGLLFHPEMQDRARPTRGKFARVPTARSPIGKAGERSKRNERDRGHDRANARLVGKMPGSLEE